ncbi:MAG: Co2+/Mg2+ efflux protein ApaG [Microscillaceae bacterium]|nr:Co2+/Mg2+ efflux protein ApaG [Microscillaceae bacterium]MDW8461068.1 Co2+/Mg2+ efflux protein ApaG [Cytophagales bacterium]
MNVLTTEGVQVSVKTAYQAAHSQPRANHFVFSYHITIENKSNYTVQLLRRHWYIYDSNGEVNEVEGEGVIGQQPILEPKEKHQYTSACVLETGMGKMRGYYLMERIADGKLFKVQIPEFMLIAPFLNN